MKPALVPLLVACACAADPLAPPEAAAILAGPYPDPPALAPAVHLVDDEAFLRPHIPPYRTTADGRVAIALDKTGASQVDFYLFAPEKLTGPWDESGPGISVLASLVPFAKSRDDFYAFTPPATYAPNVSGDLDTVDHRTICDGWPDAVARPPNPYPCPAPATGKDCYDVTIVSSYRVAEHQVQLHGKPVRIVVSQPKTAQAQIAAVLTDAALIGAPAAAAGGPLAGKFGLEPMITRDGRLLVMRIGDTPYGPAQVNGAWVNPITSVAAPPQTYDIMYAAAGESDLPCDVTAWDALHPITHLAHDPALVPRYGLAEHVLRDAKGVAYDDGEDFGGSYPWIDRDGDNLFFSMISSTLYYGDAAGALQERYAATCTDGAACVEPTTVAEIADLENDEQFRGFAMAGLWTRGKVVMFDNLANNTDYGLGRADDEQRDLVLYASGPPVRVGTGRDNHGADRAPGAVQNSTFLDSWEHLFNHDPDVVPATVRDVVWLLNTGKASVEVAFDDYLDGDAIVLSDMAAATSQVHAWSTTNQPTYLDGFVQTGPHRGDPVGGGEVGNAATSLAWAVPASGVLVGGASKPRIEPIARGGIVGKGVWLHGEDQGIEYTMPPQTRAAPAAWTVSLFVDPRPIGGAAQALLTFPDGTRVDLLSPSALRYTRGGYATTVNFPARPLVTGAWNHLGWVVRDGGRRVELYRDGYPLSTWSHPTQTLFRLFWTAPAVSAPFTVGARAGSAGFRGWIDDVKIFARDVGPEPMCNHARGTIVELPFGSDPAWYTDVAGDYPGSAHDVLRAALGTAAPIRYACFHDYANPELPLLRNLPAGAASVRADLLFPEGPLDAALPRPVSTANLFCQSCHGESRVELSPAALVLDDHGPMGAPLPAAEDPRRQPMQPPPVIHGHVPADFFFLGSPAYSDDRWIDPYVLP